MILPPSLHDWLPSNHLAYFIDETVNKLELSAIYQNYSGAG